MDEVLLTVTLLFFQISGLVIGKEEKRVAKKDWDSFCKTYFYHHIKETKDILLFIENFQMWM